MLLDRACRPISRIEGKAKMENHSLLSLHQIFIDILHRTPAIHLYLTLALLSIYSFLFEKVQEGIGNRGEEAEPSGKGCTLRSAGFEFSFL